MFDAIAARYDLLNHLLSAGMDRQWRRRAIAALQLRGHEMLLDLCAGTADLALAATDSSPSARRVIAIDFSGEMLRIARNKLAARPIELVRGDATRIPLASGTVDAVTIGFGIRNVERPLEACREIARVLGPNGKLVILEFSLPRSTLLRSLYLWYFRHLLPIIGRTISRHKTAYSYLPESVEAFPSPEEFSRQLRQSGFGTVNAVPMTFGVVYMFVAVKGTHADRVI
jgi:demethylmenaquinone methyltransferase / 2-methoxy-6-polyprenyl-1,4-benzoquinol methylase